MIPLGPRTIFCREEGLSDQLPVVLLHGFAEDGAIWDQQIEQLKNDYRLLIPDLPGSGRSSPLIDATSSSALADETPAIPPEGASMEDLADIILALLDSEGIKRCVLIGHSMGGYIALAFANKYPKRLLGLGLFHSTAYADTEEKKAARQKSIEFIRKNGSAAFIRQSTPNLFAADTQSSRPGLLNDMISRYSSFLPDSLTGYYEAMIRRPDRTQVLKEFAGPVLFVIGAQDQAVPPRHALEQSHMPALSHIHILDNAAHLGMLEATDRCNQILHTFLNFVTYS